MKAQRQIYINTIYIGVDYMAFYISLKITLPEKKQQLV